MHSNSVSEMILKKINNIDLDFEIVEKFVTPID